MESMFRTAVCIFKFPNSPKTPPRSCPMTRVLRTPELLDMIAEGLGPRELACFGRISQQFYLHTIRLLWKTMDARKFACLARIVMDPTDEIVPDMDARWQRFRMIASTVESLGVDLGTDIEIGDLTITPGVFRSYLQHLATLQPAGTPLLPNVRIMSFRARCPEDLFALLPFLQPSLRNLAISCWADAQDTARWGVPLGSVLLRLKAKCQDLVMLGLHGVSGSQHCSYRNSLKSLISSLPKLLFFRADLGALAPDVLAELSKHPTVKTLQVGVVRKRDSLANKYECDPVVPIRVGELGALRHLQLEMDLKTVTTFLQGTTSAITSLNLLLVEETLAGQDIYLLSQAMAHCSNNLNAVQIRLAERSGKLDQPAPFSFTAFSPLLSSRTIKSFRLDYRSAAPFDFQDAFITPMAKAWPRLTELAVTWMTKLEQDQISGNGGGLADEQAVKLDCLATIAQQMPHLRLLHFTTFYLPAQLPRLPVRDPRGAPLFKLDMGDTELPVPEMNAVATFLLNIWPGVHIYCRPPRNEYEWARQQMWHSVNRVLREIAEQRRLERDPKGWVNPTAVPAPTQANVRFAFAPTSPTTTAS